MAKRKTLGAPAKHHAALAKTFTTQAEIGLKHMKGAKSCRVQFDHLHDAINATAKAWSHGFGSKGRIHKGALTPRTISETDAKRLYDVDHEVTKAAQKFRGECLKDDSGLGGARRRRRR